MRNQLYELCGKTLFLLAALIAGAGINFLTIRAYGTPGVIAVCLNIVLAMLGYMVFKKITSGAAKSENINAAYNMYSKLVWLLMLYFIAFLFIPAAILLGCCGSFLFLIAGAKLAEKLKARNRKKVSRL
ncbi:MAG: hypothetical protein V4478_01700 [Patescibacteria group bacterium]